VEIPELWQVPAEEYRTESGLILPSEEEKRVFGGGVNVDVERAQIAAVLVGLLLPVLMMPALAPIAAVVDWVAFLLPVFYHALGKLPKD
jgi:hypothetical protein